MSSWTPFTHFRWQVRLLVVFHFHALLALMFRVDHAHPLFAVLEKKTTARQGRDELIKKGLLEIMEPGK